MISPAINCGKIPGGSERTMGKKCYSHCAHFIIFEHQCCSISMSYLGHLFQTDYLPESVICWMDSLEFKDFFFFQNAIKIIIVGVSLIETPNNMHLY